jgi:hypothetical protein
MKRERHQYVSSVVFCLQSTIHTEREKKHKNMPIFCFVYISNDENGEVKEAATSSQRVFYG